MEPDDYNTRALAPDVLLWHYTNFKGLQGILRGGVWASSAPYLNDTQEFHHGVTIALEVLQQELEAALRDHELRDNQQYASIIYRLVVSFFGGPQFREYKPHYDVFVASLSTRADDLGQWRAYGGGPAPMFSIGFNPEALEKKASETSFDLEEVKYRKNDIVPELRLALRAPIDQILETLSTSTGPPLLAPESAARLVRELLTLAPLYKHESFAAEQEWRLIRREGVLTREPALRLQFRLSGSLVIPYLEMPLHAAAGEADISDMSDMGASIQSPIASITIGPSPHPDELLYAVKEMTRSFGLLRVRIELSSVPFRNW